jgi:SulP family sulfate permease
MRPFKPDNLTGDFWGGFASMLVALPSAIAFGVTIYSPLGGSYAAMGALAGILGVTALGLLAPVLGGTNRLISAPCAPAAAVLSAFVIEFMRQSNTPEAAMLMLVLMGLLAGAIQLVFGVVGLGRLIKYMPYPVVSGYLSGVGLYIIASQVPKLLGVSSHIHFWESLASASLWKWQGIVVGAVTMAVMFGAPKLTKAVPAAILGLLAGVLTYCALGLMDPKLLMLAGNSLVIGSFSASGGGSFIDGLTGRWNAVGSLHFPEIVALALPAMTLAVLLSIDTLKTCVVLDALTRTRHDSNRELRGQGIGNMASALIGGMPGAGTMGATLVNISSGGMSRLSGIIEGALALVAFLLLGSVIAWVPVAALSGILIVVGVRMIDRHTLSFLKSSATILDFLVIAAVVVTALTVSLIAASGVGIVLAIVLFVREKISERVVRNKTYGNHTFSKQIRAQREMDILASRGDQAVIFELQGSLFFGTTDQLYTALEPELKKCTYLILDMRRVQEVDLTAVHMLDQIKDMLSDRKGYLIFSQVPDHLPTGMDMQQYFDQVGLVRPDSPVKVFEALDNAIEWVEDRILAEESLEHLSEELLDLHELELFKGRKEETLRAIDNCMQRRSYTSGEQIFACGDAGDELFLIRRGAARILLPINGVHSLHISTLGRGVFFGELSFLDGCPRAATAVAYGATDVFVLSRSAFNQLGSEHHQAALNLLESLAKALSGRLRSAYMEMRSMEAA